MVIKPKSNRGIVSGVYSERNGGFENIVVNRSGKEIFSNLRTKLFSPLYLVIMIMSVIILGNFMNWADVVYGTHFNTLNPIMVLLTIILFGMYLYSIRGEYKKRRRE